MPHSTATLNPTLYFWNFLETNRKFWAAFASSITPRNRGAAQGCGVPKDAGDMIKVSPFTPTHRTWTVRKR